MTEAERVVRVGHAVWFDGCEHLRGTPSILGMVGDDGYLVEIDGANRERLILDMIDSCATGARSLRIEMAFFGRAGNFFASPVNFIEHWPRSSTDMPADVFIDERYKATFTRAGDEVVVNVRHALRPPGGPQRRRLRFGSNEYDEMLSHLEQEAHRLRDDLVTAALERAPAKVGVLQAAFRRPPGA